MISGIHEQKYPYQSYQQSGFGTLTTPKERPQSYEYKENAYINTQAPSLFIPTTQDMEQAQRIAEINPFEGVKATGINKTSEKNYFTRPQNESRELENSDIRGSELGYHLDLQGIENKAWGKQELYV